MSRLVNITRQRLITFYNKLREDLGSPPWDVETHYGQWPMERIRSYVEPCLSPKEVRELRHTLFCSLPTMDGNAYAIWVPTGGALLCVDANLQFVLLNLSIAFFAMTGASSLGSSANAASAEDHVLTCARTLHEGLDAMSRSPFLKSAADVYALLVSEDAPHHPPEGHIIEVIINEGMLSFVMLHESFHYLRGHLDESRVFDFSLCHGQMSVRAFSKTQLQELEADREALLALITSAEDTESAKCNVVLPVELFFLLLEVYEHLFPLTHLPDQLTHPPARSRILALREWYARACSKPVLTEVSEFMDHVYASLCHDHHE